jgi:hypothetical protein
VRATTVKIEIGPGTEIARQLATRRDAMLRERERARQERVRVRTDELETGRVPAARQLAQFIARRDAVAREVGPRELAAADAALRLAIRTGKLDGLRELLNRLELGAEQSSTIRARQVLVLDRLARHLPSWLCMEAVVRGSDDVLRMHTRLDDGRELVIAARGDAVEGHTQTLDFELAAGEADPASELDTDAGELAAAICGHLFARETDLTTDGGVEKVLELGIATVGFTMSAASFPTEWQAGEYGGVVLTAIAIGMLLARHFRRP